jgi:DNA-binding SARP family transcriptional activator
MALGLYKGDFLEGFHLRSCQNFDEWIIIERERLRNLVITALQKLVRHHINSGNFKSAIPYLRQVLDLNPLLETAHQQLMKSLTFIGQRESALNQFDICRAILKEELSVSPSDDTRELFEQIKSGKLLLPDATARHNQKHHRKQ